jgi:hypothetical protein
VIAQREFWREFGIHRNRAVPSAHAIKTWVRNFEDTGSIPKKKGGSVKRVRTPKNIAVVREAIEWSPHHSERRHSVSLGLSEASVQRILNKDQRECRTSSLEVSNSVLMAWVDGTARLRWIPNTLQNSRWAITKLSQFL